MDGKSVKYNAYGDKITSGDDTTPNDEFWEYSAVSKSVFFFDDDDDDNLSWSYKENHFNKLKHPASTGTQNSTNTSKASSFESIHRIDEGYLDNVYKVPETETISKKAIRPKSFVVNTVSGAISHILRGEPYVLESFKSKEDKISLLDSAIGIGDGNAITAAVLHFRKTMRPSIFNQEISIRPVAISHYVNYLENHHDFNDLHSFYLVLGRKEDAAILKFKLAMMQKNVEQKIHHLEECLKFHFSNDPKLAFYCNMIQDQISLLQKQLAIAKSDEQHSKQNASHQHNQAQAHVAPYNTLVGMSVITSLYYCTLYHYSEPENSFSSPLSIKKSYQLSDKQYSWTVVSALAKRNNWNAIQLFLTTKSLFGGSKLKSCIGFDKIAEIVQKANAPPDIVAMYLKLIDSIDLRLDASKKLQCHAVAIDTYVQLKDAQGLRSYKSLLKPGTHEYSYLESALRASTIKWKN